MIKRKKTMGPVMEILLIIVLISILSLILSLFGVNGKITENGSFETTLTIIKNIFGKDGIKYILGKTISIFQSNETLVEIIISLISISIMEASGLLKHLFSPLKKVNFKYVTLIVMIIGMVSTIFGDFSYAIFLPLAGILYKYIGKDPALGVLSMFISITIGYGAGILYNFQTYELSSITETAARTISSTYNYKFNSSIFFVVFSTIVLSIIGMISLERLSKKYTRSEIEDNLTLSKKAFRVTSVVFIIMILLLIYSMIPGLPHSGLLLDKNQSTYIAKLFNKSSLFTKSFQFLIILIFIICGLVYGVLSRNIKNAMDFSKSLTKTFEKTGYVFVLLFFVSILFEIIDWTNIFTVFSTNIVDFVGSSTFSGLILIILSLISIIIVTLFIPNLVNKWTIVAPIYIPLLMRANISPVFTQLIFVVGDSIGKIISPIYTFLFITIGFMYKYDKDGDFSVANVLKNIFPTICIMSLTWIIILIGWYLTGLPLGINSNITL